MFPSRSGGRNDGYMGNAISVENLVKTYTTGKNGALNAVDGLDLNIREGECFCLLGPNGAGKSTTVEMLEGQRKPSSGTISVLGYHPWEAGPEFKARIGVVLQEASDGSLFTVAQVMRQLAALYPNPANIEELVAAVGLSEKWGAKVKSLSGGQRRRLDVALGIVGRPEVLFLDEPTTGFDPISRRQFWDLIRTLHAEGTTIVLTTHYLDEAEALADRIGIINHGVKITEGTPQEIGGPDARTPRVRWLGPDGHVHERITSEPTELLRQLMPDSGEIRDLQIVRPSLEDVYVELVGEQNEAEKVEVSA